jgi:arsenate reductase (glutaredoxin)
LILYYNPECSKCQKALSLLDSKGCAIELRNYLTDPPSVEEIRSLLKKLGIRAEELVRKTEPLYITKFEGHEHTEDEWITIMSANPILIERPIIINGSRALIGRPVERVLEFTQEP